MQAPFTLNGNEVAAGKRQTIDIDIGRLYTHNEITMPVHIIHGKEAGNVLLVSAAIHGDEIAGVEIIRRLLKSPSLKRIKGTLVAIPIVNVHGFINMSRYLPDRRDLNRSFPGSKKGSLAGRMANLFMEEIMSKVTHGVDLHTGAIHRTNFPQIRANLDDPTTLSLAEAFGTPALLNSEIREGSLRQAAANIGIPILVYEAGEALRFDEMSIRTGLKGILNIMYQLDMLTPSAKRKPRKKIEPFIARSSSWVRAPESGIVRLKVKPGQRVKKVIFSVLLLTLLVDRIQRLHHLSVVSSSAIITCRWRMKVKHCFISPVLRIYLVLNRNWKNCMNNMKSTIRFL